MNPAIAIRKTLDGRVQARRIDGKPLSVQDREDARLMVMIEELPPRASVVEEVRDEQKLRAVKICSTLVEEHLWLLLDRTYQPRGGLAIYYPEELPVLNNKTPEQLREIHKVK